MSKEINKKILDAKLPDSIKAGVEAIAKAMGVAAVELWEIFVRQYVVKGLTEVFTAFVLIGAGVFIATQFGYWSLIPLTAALPFCYGAIMLLGNPKYYAINDITKKINELK
jgi:hypothetical protein